MESRSDGNAVAPAFLDPVCMQPHRSAERTRYFYARFRIGTPRASAMRMVCAEPLYAEVT